MLEKRISVSPPEAAISWLDGKLPPIFHVNIVTVVLENGVLLGKQLNHRVEYAAQPDGSFLRTAPVGGEPDADIEAALVSAEGKTQALIAALVAHQGVMDYVTADGAVVRHEKTGDLYTLKVTEA